MDSLDGRDQLSDALQGVVLTLDRHEDLVRRTQRVDREQAERGRAVDQHVVVVVDDGVDCPVEPSLAAEGRHQLDLGAGQFEVCRGDEQALDAGRLDAVLERHVVQQDVVHRRVQTALDAQARRRVGLRVDVDDQDSLAEVGEGRADVDRRRRLADTAFEIGDGDDAGERVPPGPNLRLWLGVDRRPIRPPRRRRGTRRVHRPPAADRTRSPTAAVAVETPRRSRPVSLGRGSSMAKDGSRSGVVPRGTGTPVGVTERRFMLHVEHVAGRPPGRR